MLEQRMASEKDQPRERAHAGRDLPASVVALLAQHGETIATAESCTGGLVCGALTDVPGSGTVVYGGVVAYIPPAKMAALGVAEETLERHTVYSAEVAAEMADGVRALLGATWGIGTTGVAGPGADGGVEPGRVWIAVHGPDGAEQRAFRFDGDREAVRQHAVEAALALLLQALERPRTA